MQTLSEMVRSIRTEKKLSSKDVENNSGGEITDSYVLRVESGID